MKIYRLEVLFLLKPTSKLTPGADVYKWKTCIVATGQPTGTEVQPTIYLRPFLHCPFYTSK